MLEKSIEYLNYEESGKEEIVLKINCSGRKSKMNRAAEYVSVIAIPREMISRGIFVV